MVSPAKLTQFSIVCKLGELILIMIKEFPCFRQLERKVVRAKPQGPPESKREGRSQVSPWHSRGAYGGVRLPLSSKQGTWPEAPLPERLLRSRGTQGEEGYGRPSGFIRLVAGSTKAAREGSCIFLGRQSKC